jgi:hypothetical protein
MRFADRDLPAGARRLRRMWRGGRRLLGKVRRHFHPLKVVVIQSSDPVFGLEMLTQSARTSKEFCRRHGYEYRSFIGIHRGFHPWQASYNRVFQLKELCDEGFRGWVFYIDSDAVIVDLDFDLHELMPGRSIGLVACLAGGSDFAWDINGGIFLLNLGSRDGRTIVDRWYHMTMSLSEKTLRGAETWLNPVHDQALLQFVLASDPALTRRAVHHVPREILNHEGGTFVRHFLRATGLTVAEREAKLKAVADGVLGAT